MQIDITDENGETRKAWVCRIVAERDLVNMGAGGEEVVVAKKGDKGGYVECDVEFDEDGNPHPILPVQPGEDGAPSTKYEGEITGLSQNGTSWVHAGVIAAGETSVRDDAQIVGPDTMITGADKYAGDVAAGGSYYRSNGMSTFEGTGTYIDMELETGAQYQFSGGTQVGGPVLFERGSGEFCDGPAGEETMLFAAEEGTSLTIATEDGFKSNGLTALDNTDIRGSFEANPDLIVQNSEINVQGTKFTGPATVVNQTVGMEANGMELAGDADIDAVSLTAMADEMTGLTGTERHERIDAEKAYTDSDAYKAHVANVVAHELGENFGDAGEQKHEGDIHDEMNRDMYAEWDASSEDTTRDQFYEEHRISSEYQAGINDAPTEDIREIMDVTGMTVEELEAARTAADGGIRVAQRDTWSQFSGTRLAYQPDAHKNLTNGRTQRDLTGDEGSLNPDASDGLLNEEARLTPDSFNTGRTRPRSQNLGSLAAMAERFKEEGKQKEDDGLEAGG